MEDSVAQIRSLMKSGDVAGAEVLCRKALEKDQDNAVVKMLYATCRNLQGDEETFRRIMLEIAPQMESLAKADPDCEAAKLWRKSGAVLMEYVVLGVLLVAAAVGGVIVFGKQIKNRLQIMCHAYGPAPDIQLVRELYGPALDIERLIEPPVTNDVESVADETVAPTNAVETVRDSAGETTP